MDKFSILSIQSAMFRGQNAMAYVLRRIINPMGTLEAMEFLLDKLRLTKTNSDFYNSMNQ